MENNSFDEVEEKIATQLGCSRKILSQYYDKKIATTKQNKDGEYLFIFRKLMSKELVNEMYSNTAKYSIYSKAGQCLGEINLSVSNTSSANQVEVEYISEEEFRNKGNITISLDEVLKDIFIDKSFDGLHVKSNYPKTVIKEVFLSINDDNYASKAIAKKSGFIKKGKTYVTTPTEQLAHKLYETFLIADKKHSKDEQAKSQYIKDIIDLSSMFYEFKDLYEGNEFLNRVYTALDEKDGSYFSVHHPAYIYNSEILDKAINQYMEQILVDSSNYLKTITNDNSDVELGIFFNDLLDKRTRNAERVKQANLTPLQQREKELSELEREEKTISEAEALIKVQEEKEGQSIGDE